MDKNNPVVIVSAARTPFGSFKGSLKGFSAYELGAMVIEEVIKRAGIEKNSVDEVFMGCAIEGENEDFMAACVARQALLKAGLPAETISLTVDKACCSSMVAAQLAYKSIKMDPSLCVIAVGAECFSRVPFIVGPELRLGLGKRLTHVTIRDPLIRMGYKDYNPVSVDAGDVALEYHVSREDQDHWAFMSQQRYQEAERLGRFKDEIVPVTIEDEKGNRVVFDKDEFPKPYTTLEKLSKLPTVYGSPTVTAGNAPGLNDGASALLLMSQEKARGFGLEPLGELVATGSVADEPRLSTIVPASVIKKILVQTSMTLEEIDLIEINEAFAAMPSTCCRILSEGDPKKEEEIRNKTNVNGGAIAIGHPLAASATRLVMTLMYEMRRRGGGYGIAAICGGLAQGEGVMIKV
ncbi:MAG: thiolase family protein [Proteobacteria bacterium]|nr:thiolase family protein [Pseudomonadota bacterium]